MSYVQHHRALSSDAGRAIIEQRGDLARASVESDRTLFVPSTEKLFIAAFRLALLTRVKGDISAFDSKRVLAKRPLGEVLKMAKDLSRRKATFVSEWRWVGCVGRVKWVGFRA